MNIIKKKMKKKKNKDIVKMMVMIKKKKKKNSKIIKQMKHSIKKYGNRGNLRIKIRNCNKIRLRFS